MIWESSDWKKPLLKLSKQIHKWKEKSLSDKDLVDIEKTILIAFYSIRKLVDARKLSNTTQEMKINIFSYPNVKNVTLMNWHKIDELYNLEEENPKQCDLSFIYNQLIHSYVFMIDDNPKGGFNGIFFSSDSQRNKKVFKISADELIRILDTVGNDYSSSSRLEFNEVKQDYDVFKP
jgi:hypothetical protein